MPKAWLIRKASMARSFGPTISTILFQGICWQLNGATMAQVLGKLQIFQIPICAQPRNLQLCMQKRPTRRKITTETILCAILWSYKMVLQTTWKQRNQVTVFHTRLCLDSYFFLNLCPEEVLNLIKKKKQINSTLCGTQKTTSSCKQEPQDIKDNG